MTTTNMIGPIGTRVSFVTGFDDNPKEKKHYGVLVKFDRSQALYKVIDGKGLLWLIYSTDFPPTPAVPLMKLRAMANKDRVVVLHEMRSDGYQHYGVVINGKSALSAGCQHFTTLDDALQHWKTRRRRPAYYQARKNKTNIAYRARDKKLNAFSIAFARKLERLRIKGAK